MPRTTKAEMVAALERNAAAHLKSQMLTRSLQEQIERLGMQNEDLKAQITRRPRSRSPKRFSASSSQKQMDMSCKALFQAKQWQRDQVLEERDEKIAELMAENVRKDEQIASLRRGDGPIGEVLAHNDALSVAKYNLQRTPQIAARFAELFAQQTMPVNAAIVKMEQSLREGSDFLRWGREP